MDGVYVFVRAEGSSEIGLKVYGNNDNWPDNSSFEIVHIRHAGEGDYTFATIESHIRQLAPVVQRNLDVVYWGQAGFIGSWGEWHHSNRTCVGSGGEGALGPTAYFIGSFPQTCKRRGID